MPHAPIAADILETGDVLGDLATKLPLHDIVLVHERGQSGQFVLMEILRHSFGINPGLVAQFASHPRTDTVEVLERVERLLLRWNVDAEETGHGGVLPLG
jgi:hypothetical protein